MQNAAAIVPRIKEFFLREEYPARTALVKEGRTAAKIYFVEKGLARAWFDSDGKETTFQFIGENQFISSFESLLDKTPSWYSIETIEPVVVFSTTVEEFRLKMEQFPHVKEFYYHYVQQRLLLYQHLFISRIRLSPEQRYQELLRQQPDWLLRVPQHYIASYLGITPVSLSRIRNRR